MADNKRFEVRGDDVTSTGVIVDTNAHDKRGLCVTVPGEITPELLQQLKDSFTRKTPE